MNVSNRSCIRRLATKSMRASRGRNIIAVLAIALTALLFTSLFTIAMSINESAQEASFRQVGGYAHGSFKYLTEQERDELKTDKRIKDYGMRLILGMADGDVFSKSHVEVSYCDPNEAKWMYCEPIQGRLPQEGTNEAATDTRVLELLGVEPRLGASFTIEIMVDGTPTTQNFTLCGFWEYDEAITANHVLVPQSFVEGIFDTLGTQGLDGMTTRWGLDVMFASSMHIERDVLDVLSDHGYQGEDRTQENYIATGVNWGYTGAKMADSMDLQTIGIIVVLLLVFLLTGYLIIYNVFRISVSNNIRFYGLLKTIGTTGRQLRRVIRVQALTLSCLGIPLGLLAGYFVGVGLTPVILEQLNGMQMDTRSASPIIFIGSALFALLTVLISCAGPGRLAGKVSPIEAVRYTEGHGARKKLRKSTRGASILRMAFANLGRSRTKTVVTLLSLALAVLLLNMTVTFTSGFDMDKYVSLRMAADFMLADADYFQVTKGWHGQAPLSEEFVADLEAQDGIEAGGRVYGKSSAIQEFLTEDYYRSVYSKWTSPDNFEKMLQWQERDEQGLVADRVQLYGMEEYALGKLKLLEGDLSKLSEPGGRYVAAVLLDDDYGNPIEASHWAKVGDRVKLRYVEESENLDPETGEILTDAQVQSGAGYRTRSTVYRDVEYEVVALVCMPSSLSYRYYGADEFVMGADTFVQETGTDHIMYYALDAEEGKTAALEDYFVRLTQEEQTQLDYESKATMAAEFAGFQNMFLLLGGVLSGIVGLVGVLNFLNAILTGILTRRREFAVLQSIGMTGSQLKRMLILEGLVLAVGSLLLTLFLTCITGPLLANVLEEMFWFFSYHFILTPILLTLPVFVLLGVLLPLLVYRSVSRHSVVERLRECE